MAGEPEVDALHAVLGESIDDPHPVRGGVFHRHAIDAEQVGAASSHLRRTKDRRVADEHVGFAQRASSGVQDEVAAKHDAVKKHRAVFCRR